MDKQITVNAKLSRNVSIAILVGVLVGAVVGGSLLIHKLEYSPRHKMYAGYAGELLFQMFHCVAMPLVMSSLTCAVAYTHHPAVSWRLALQFIVILLLSKIHVILLTSLLIKLIHPGEGLQINTDDHNTLIIQQNLAESVLDVVRNIFPQSVIRMTIMHVVTNVTLDQHNKPDIATITRDGCNWLGLVMISAFIGLALHGIDPAAESPIYSFFAILEKISIRILHGIIWVAPLLVISTVTGQMVFASSSRHLQEVGKYCAVVLIAMVLQLFVFYPIIINFVARRNPLKEYRDFWLPFLVSGATGCSLTAMPLCNFPPEYDPEIVKTMLPLSLILNKDGACIFFTAATLSTVLYNGKKLDVGNSMVTCLLAIPLSMACPGIPQGGLLMLPITLMGMSIQYHDMAIVIVMDWLLDRCLTLVNVAGTIAMLGILNKWNVPYIDRLLHEEQIQRQRLRDEAITASQLKAEQEAENEETINT